MSKQSGGSWLPAAGVGVLGVLGLLVVFTLMSDPVIGPDATPEPEALASPPEFFLKDQIAFAPAPVPAEALQAAMAQLPGRSDPPPKGMDQVVKALEQLNLKELSGDPKAHREAAAEFNLRLTEFYGVQHNIGYQALVKHIYKDFRAALTTLSEAAKAKNTPIDTLITTPTPDIAAAHRLAGGFIPVARTIGLMDATGAIPARLEPLVEVFFRYRFAQGMRGTLNPAQVMTGVELIALDHWRLHEGKNIGLDRRLRYADRLGTRAPGYPSWIAKGIVYHDAKDPQRARDAFTHVRDTYPRYKPLMERYLGLLPPAKTP